MGLIKQPREGKVFLGQIEVDMGKMFMFGKEQPLHQMVSFIPGTGNGLYDVYGEIEYVEGHGWVTTKIEVEFISPEEKKYYAEVAV